VCTAATGNNKYALMYEEKQFRATSCVKKVINESVIVVFYAQTNGDAQRAGLILDITNKTSF